MRLTLQQLEAHLSGAAGILRGKTAGQDYKNYILSLLFYKRLCDQWENEADEAIAELEAQQRRVFSESQRAVFRARGEHRFSIPDGARWGDIKAASTNLGEVLTRAMRAVSSANEELRGVFTVDWNQPAPDGSGKALISNEVVHALFQHFDGVDLSNRGVPPDILGRAYEFLIKQFADDAGARAGEFFTPPQVVDALVRMLEPRPGDEVYDPTSGSGGMLVHAGEYLRECGHHATSAQYCAQEMNWGNAAIGKINSVLHGLEADIRAGASTITDPQFLDEEGGVRKFSLVLANFPFSDEYWWLKPEQQTDDKKRRQRLKKEIFGKEGYKDPLGRFGRGTEFPSPPAGYGDYAFLLHILASLADSGRAGVVCPQGVLFRGQPETESETGEFDDAGNSIVRRRKADDEFLIRRALLDGGMIDAVISLPLNVFYGAGLPACLVLLRRDRPDNRRDQVLLVYAARHFRELSAQNELRPQDVMRLLVHYQAYGDSKKVPSLLHEHGARIRDVIDDIEEEEAGRIAAEYQGEVDARDTLDASIAVLQTELDEAETATARGSLSTAIGKLTKARGKAGAKLVERDRLIAEARRRATEDREDLDATATELLSIYEDPLELLKHARVVERDEIEENDFNLNIPRFVDTFEPEPVTDVDAARQSMDDALSRVEDARQQLDDVLAQVGYEAY